MNLRALKIFYSFSAEIVFKRQILMYKDGPRAERVEERNYNSIPANTGRRPGLDAKVTTSATVKSM